MVENRTSTGDGCRFTYDLAAGLTTVEHYDGQTRKHYWNAQNLIVRYVDESGENWRYEWDDNELLTRRIDPLGNAVTFVYDDMGNRVQDRRRRQHPHHHGWSTARFPRPLSKLTAAPPGSGTTNITG